MGIGDWDLIALIFLAVRRGFGNRDTWVFDSSNRLLNSFYLMPLTCISSVDPSFPFTMKCCCDFELLLL